MNRRPSPASVARILKDFFEGHSVTLSGTPRFDVIAAMCEVVDADESDLKQFLQSFLGRLRNPPGTWMYVVRSILGWLEAPGQVSRFKDRRQRAEQIRKLNREMRLMDAVAVLESGELAVAVRESGLVYTQITVGLLMALERKGVTDLSPRDLIMRQSQFWDNVPCRRCLGEGIIWVFDEAKDRVLQEGSCDCACADQRKKRQSDLAQAKSPIPEQAFRSAVTRIQEQERARRSLMERERGG